MMCISCAEAAQRLRASSRNLHLLPNPCSQSLSRPRGRTSSLAWPRMHAHLACQAPKLLHITSFIPLTVPYPLLPPLVQCGMPPQSENLEMAFEMARNGADLRTAWERCNKPDASRRLPALRVPPSPCCAAAVAQAVQAAAAPRRRMRRQPTDAAGYGFGGRRILMRMRPEATAMLHGDGWTSRKHTVSRDRTPRCAGFQIVTRAS